ncbi:MAG: P-II family nitrogen regulator [Rubripirellula sp.]
MKIVTAIIKPAKLDAVRDELAAIGAVGVTATKVKGFGHQKGHSETYRGALHEINFNPKIKLESAVDDAMVDQVIEVICKVAHTGQIGDGKIFVTPLERAVRIRTNESGAAAL